MNLQGRVELMVNLGDYIRENSLEWQHTIIKAYEKNPWFLPVFSELASKNITDEFLDPLKLGNWAEHYRISGKNAEKTVGIIMAGNIPMVGFHDFLCAFINGNQQKIKLSSKDDVLLKFLINKMIVMEPAAQDYIEIADQLKKCDAYIATGSANTSRYFHEYFGKYPNIIRSNKTSMAVLTGEESPEELEKLADDIHIYFGLGCRNVTKLFVPPSFDFEKLLKAFSSYAYFADINKYRNNFDYQLTICLMNKKMYMTNGSTLLIENESVFSPISVVHYEFYEKDVVIPESVQCVIGKQYIPFGDAQKPDLFDYADGVDTIGFLQAL